MKEIEHALNVNLRKPLQSSVTSVTHETVMNLQEKVVISPSGFVHCALTQMKLPITRLELLGFYKNKP
jgi:hypothetical protein